MCCEPLCCESILWPVTPNHPPQYSFKSLMWAPATPSSSSSSSSLTSMRVDVFITAVGCCAIRSSPDDQRGEQREEPRVFGWAPSGVPHCNVLNHGWVLKSFTWSGGHSRHLLIHLFKVLPSRKPEANGQEFGKITPMFVCSLWVRAGNKAAWVQLLPSLSHCWVQLISSIVFGRTNGSKDVLAAGFLWEQIDL